MAAERPRRPGRGRRAHRAGRARPADQPPSPKGADRNRAMGVMAAPSPASAARWASPRGSPHRRTELALGAVRQRAPASSSSSPECCSWFPRPARSRPGLTYPAPSASPSGCGALTYGLSEASVRGWGSPNTVVPLVAAGVLLVAFLVVEARGSPRSCRWIFRHRNRSSAYADHARDRLVADRAVLLPDPFTCRSCCGSARCKTGFAFLTFAVGTAVCATRAAPWWAGSGAAAAADRGHAGVGGRDAVAVADRRRTAATAPTSSGRCWSAAAAWGCASYR